MDKAGELMASLPPERAARDMSGAIDYLLAYPSTIGDAVGVTGFCMGGMPTLMIAALEGSRMVAAAPFYGAPLGDDGPDWSGLTARVEGRFAAVDDFFPPDAVQGLEPTLRGMGRDVTFHDYEGTGHAFANEENPLGTLDEKAAATAWNRPWTCYVAVSEARLRASRRPSDPRPAHLRLLPTGPVPLLPGAGARTQRSVGLGGSGCQRTGVRRSGPDLHPRRSAPGP